MTKPDCLFCELLREVSPRIVDSDELSYVIEEGLSVTQILLYQPMHFKSELQKVCYNFSN